MANKTTMEKNNELYNGNLQYALEYIARGWRIFPCFYVLASGQCSCRNPRCKRIGKHPILKNGVLGASSDETQVRAWWTDHPFANIGLACGHDGLIVTDVDEGIDKKTGAPKVGPASLKALVEANRSLPETLTARTGGGGRHYYYISTEEIKNSQDLVGKHIDVRGHGGYVILPPSNHESGKKYEWETPQDAPIADMPEWLERIALKHSEVDVSVDFDPKQDAEIAKRVNKKFTAEQLIKLLEWIPADCDRDTWWQVGAALKKELGNERGYKVWIEWSKKAPALYDEKTAESQWNSFVDKALTGGTIFHFAQQNGFKSFDAVAADDPEIIENWLAVISIKRFVETRLLLEWDREQFDINFLPLFARGKPSDHFLRNTAFRRLNGCTYWPRQPLIVTEDGQSKLNYWRPSDVTPAPGDITRFLEHVAYLFPGDRPVDADYPSILVAEEGEILLDYLAYQVQNPGEKVHWAVLIEGDQGNGKSYFALVMRIVLGPHNVRMVTNEELHEVFTKWQRNTQLVVVEEMMAKGRLELMNKLKPIITEPWCTIREMYRPPYEQPNRFNFLFFSNHPDSLVIDDTDRRYCILKTASPPHADKNAYYGPLFDWTRNNGPALAYCLQHRDLSNFQAKAHAPMTAGKRALIKQSFNALEDTIYELVATKDWPFNYDLVDPASLVEPLKKFGHSVNHQQIGKAFTKLRYVNLKRMREGDERIRLWAVRESERYSEMTVDQLRRIYHLQIEGKLDTLPKETAVSVPTSVVGIDVTPDIWNGIPVQDCESESERIMAKAPENPHMKRKPKNPVVDGEPFGSLNARVTGAKKGPERKKGRARVN